MYVCRRAQNVLHLEIASPSTANDVVGTELLPRGEDTDARGGDATDRYKFDDDVDTTKCCC
jgi:hypothetical protein